MCFGSVHVQTVVVVSRCVLRMFDAELAETVILHCAPWPSMIVLPLNPCACPNRSRELVIKFGSLLVTRVLESGAKYGKTRLLCCAEPHIYFSVLPRQNTQYWAGDSGGTAADGTCNIHTPSSLLLPVSPCYVTHTHRPRS